MILWKLDGTLIGGTSVGVSQTLVESFESSALASKT